MALSEQDLLVLQAIQGGLPLHARPYEIVGESIGMSEACVMERLEYLQEIGVMKRLGVIVRHHELGYRRNGMCVWDIPDDRLEEIGHAFSAYDFVTLCYERPRRMPDWPYNLFCMIHGKDRDVVLEQAECLVRENGLEDIQRNVLFSTKRFKQRGAHYGMCSPAKIKEVVTCAK